VIWFFCLSSVHTTGGPTVEKGVRFPATFTTSGFERFFQDVERWPLLTTDVDELSPVAAEVGIDILGPPLSDEEVRQILAKAHAS
jgi:hypothetical protein